MKSSASSPGAPRHARPRALRGKTGFTRQDLVNVIALAVMLAGGWVLFYVVAGGGGSRIKPGVRANAAVKTGKAIHTWLQIYAHENNGRFPEAPDFSNTAFRQLFVKQYLDDEQAFAIGGDAWLNHAPGGNKKPDNDIGEEPDFAQALMPGECSWAYVTGLTDQSDPTLPLLGNAFSETIGVYAKNRAKKGGVFGGERAVWVTVGGSAKAPPLNKDLIITGERNGKAVNVYSKEWGTVPGNVRNPAG